MNILFSIPLWIAYFISLYVAVFWMLILLDTRHEKEVKQTPKGRPMVTIAVPVWNEEKSVVGTLQSIAALDYPKSKLQVIVVNDGSTDGTKRLVMQYMLDHPDEPVTLINQENSGKGKALNAALAKAKGSYFACLDADSFVHKDTLKKMLALYEESGEDLAIVTPIMKIAPPQTLWQRLQRVEYIVGMFLAKLMSYLDCLYVAPGPFSLYKVTKLKELGGFSNHLTEDQEIAYRAQQAHMQLKQCPEAFVYTLGPRNWKGLYAQRNRWFKGGLDCAYMYKNLILNKNYGDFGLIQMSVNIIMFALAAVTIFFSGYYIVWPAVMFVYDLALIGFDIGTLWRTLELSFDILAVDLPKTFILLSTFGLTLGLFYLAHQNVGERLRQHGALTMIPYFLMYYIVLSFIAVVVAAEYAVGHKQKW